MKKTYTPTPVDTFQTVDHNKCYGVQVNSIRGIVALKGNSPRTYLIVDVRDLKCLNEAYQYDSLAVLVDKVHKFGHQVFQFDTAKEMYQWALESL